MEHFSENKILSLISYFADRTKYCGKTKLAKLLFFSDWDHLKTTGKTITGQSYFAFPWGPFPKSLFIHLQNKTDYLGSKVIFIDDEKSDKQIGVKFKYDPKYFSKCELSIMERNAEIYRDALAKDMVKVSHWFNQPWTYVTQKLGLKALIDEKLAFKETDAKLSEEEYLERKNELEEFSNIL